MEVAKRENNALLGNWPWWLASQVAVCQRVPNIPQTRFALPISILRRHHTERHSLPSALRG
jgi:hypothetical protein